ncbi:MAG: RagB/SusD family nutrient uptake outer membrane protein [Rikenellaceae bacterium]
MMKTNIIGTTLLLVLFTATSCLSKFDSLDPNGIVYEDVAWEDLDASEAGLTAIYNALYDDELLTVEHFTICSDMGYPGYGRNGDAQNDLLDIYYKQTYTNTATEVSAKWSALYTGILRCNMLIESLEAMVENETEDPEDEEWISQMAQARFFRGLFHFFLHSTYNHGEVIIYDFVPKEGDDYLQSVSSYDDVLAFFREDLKYAYDNLVESYDTKDGRATKWAAATNLGMSYLYEAEYTEAAKYFKEVIDSGDFELVYDMDLLFTTAGEFNNESIFEINYQLGVHDEMGAYDLEAPTNMLGFTGSTNSFTLPGWITVLYQNEVMNYNDSRNWMEDAVTSTGTEDRWRTMPLRGSAMIATVQDDDTWWYQSFATSSTSCLSGVTIDSRVGNYRKFCNWDICADENDLADGARKSGKNITINRLADVYLMYAECMIDAGNLTEALKYMNLIRQRWGLQLLGTPNGDAEIIYQQDDSYDGITYTTETLLAQLQDVDRPLEMSAEGHASRFIDLRRWGADYAKTRYEYLAAQDYYMVTRTLTYGGTRYNAWLVDKYYYIDNSLTGELMQYDYDEAAKNYNADQHSYWPIPLIEEQSNPNIYGK